jgi:serine/threonine protein kinase
MYTIVSHYGNKFSLLFQNIKYTLTVGDKLGSGSYGNVNVCKLENEITRESKIIALKSNRSNDDTSFDKERIVLEELNSSGCLSDILCFVGYFTSYENSVKMYYIMTEFLSGMITLDDFICKPEYHQNISLLDCFIIITNISIALQKIHSHGLVHLDIKPLNIMIDIKSFNIKLIDFGISCRDPNIPIVAKQVSDRINICSNILGSYYYMAPELYMGIPTQWQKTDIWSMGVIFYQLLMGVIPSIYSGTTPLNIALNVGNYAKGNQGIKLGFVSEKLNDEQNRVINVLVESLIRIKPENRPTIDEFIIEISKIRTLYDDTFKSVPIIYPPKAISIASEQKVASSASEQKVASSASEQKVASSASEQKVASSASEQNVASKTEDELLAEWDANQMVGGFHAKYVYNKIHYMKL